MTLRAYITLHRKDLPVLPYCVNGLRLCPEVSEIRVIASPEIEQRCKRLGVDFIDEDGVVPGVTQTLSPHPRWGWYFQQILKLGVAWLEEGRQYLVVDADTVFLHPVRFLSETGAALYTPAWEYHEPYFESFEKLLGFRPERQASFIAHHMVFQSDLVQEMCTRFRPGFVWWRNIVDLVEPRPPQFSQSQFSEYETYGHYVQQEHPTAITPRTLRWRNVAERVSKFQIDRLSRDFEFVSFQHYLRMEQRLLSPWRVFLSESKRKFLLSIGCKGNLRS